MWFHRIVYGFVRSTSCPAYGFVIVMALTMWRKQVANTRIALCDHMAGGTIEASTNTTRRIKIGINVSREL